MEPLIVLSHIIIFLYIIVFIEETLKILPLKNTRIFGQKHWKPNHTIQKNQLRKIFYYSKCFFWICVFSVLQNNVRKIFLCGWQIFANKATTRRVWGETHSELPYCSSWSANVRISWKYSREFFGQK